MQGTPGVSAALRGPIELMVVGGLIAAWVVFENIKRTDPIYGIVGSAASLGLFSNWHGCGCR